MISTEVAVVGAGPAGSAAALTLARNGRNVVLIDKARFPRDKCCGDGLTAGALRRLESLGLRPQAVASWQPAEAVSVRSPSGRTAEFPLPRGHGTYAAVARRNDLDAALFDLARHAGATVLEGHAVGRAEHDVGRITLRTSSEPVGAAYVIAADGAWSPMRKSVSGTAESGYLGEWHALRQYFTGVSGPARRGMWVWFEPDLLPGYAWSFPLPGGGANVGLGVVRGPERGSGDLAELWASLLARSHVKEVLGPDAAPEHPTPRSWPIPSRRSALSAWQGRVLFAGDAARQADPMTGEGIAQALEGGVLAAEAIIGAGPANPATAASSYERSARRSIGTDNGVARALSRLLRHQMGARAAVRVAGSSSWSRAQFARWLIEDYPRALLLTPPRWHRGAMSRPGAYD